MLSVCVSSVLVVFKTKRLSLIVNIVFVLKYYTSRLVRSLSRCHFFLSWRLKTQDKFFFPNFRNMILFFLKKKNFLLSSIGILVRERFDLMKFSTQKELEVSMKTCLKIDHLCLKLVIDDISGVGIYVYLTTIIYITWHCLPVCDGNPNLVIKGVILFFLIYKLRNAKSDDLCVFKVNIACFRDREIVSLN